MKVRTFQINDQWDDVSWGKEKWFNASIEAFIHIAPSLDMMDYDYVQIIPKASYKAFSMGNDGAQAFRYKGTGWTFPDHCRQQGGCPEIWGRRRRHNVTISCDSPVWNYIAQW